MQSWWGRLWRRLQVELRDLLEVVAVPGLAVVLPWPACFALFRWIARRDWLYSASSQNALDEAVRRGHCPDPAAWIARRRLITLLDHADHYLVRTRSKRWLDRNTSVQGAWVPTTGPGLLWTFHWGCGMWALKHAAQAGLPIQMMLDSPRGPDFAGRWIFTRYIRARLWSVDRVTGHPVIFVPGAMAQLGEALARGRQVAVVMDVPQDQIKITRKTPLLGELVAVPSGLADIAVAERLPVTVFHMGVDWKTGRRTLNIIPLGVHDDPQALVDAAFSHLDVLMRREPAAWHLWAQAARFFTPH